MMKTTKVAAPSDVSMRGQALDVIRRHVHSQRGDNDLFDMMQRVIQAVRSAEVASARAWRILDEFAAADGE